MRTLAVIFVLAIGAIATSVYTDTLFTGEQTATPIELPTIQGESRAPLGFR